jgi:hypothetical protein
MVRKIRVIPKSAISNQKIYRTRFIQDSQTGFMLGRSSVKGKGDSTGVRRLKRNVDIDGDKKPDYLKGEIVGRTRAVKGDNKKRGTVRRRLG